MSDGYIRCEGCDGIVADHLNRIETESGLVYDTKVGGLWHIECNLIHKEFMKEINIEGIQNA